MCGKWEGRFKDDDSSEVSHKCSLYIHIIWHLSKYSMLWLFCFLCLSFVSSIVSSVAQMVRKLPAMQETWAQSLGPEDTLPKGKATTPVCLSGKSHGQSNLVGYSPRDQKELDTTEQLTLCLLDRLGADWQQKLFSFDSSTPLPCARAFEKGLVGAGEVLSRMAWGQKQ